MYIKYKLDIYKRYQPTQYYTYYLKQKRRVDGRQIQQFRNIKMTLQRNKVALCQGQTIIVAEHNVHNIKVPYLGYTTNIDKFSVKIHISNQKRRRQKYLESYVLQKVMSQKLLKNYDFFTDYKKSQHYLQTGELTLRVISQDGSIEEALILVASITLWCSMITKYEPESMPQTYFKMLEMDKVLFPVKYCQFFNEIIIDPTFQQQQKSTLEVKFLYNLLSNQLNPQIIQKFKKNIDGAKGTNQIVRSLQKLSRQHIQKIAIDLKEIRNRIQKNEDKLDIGIDNK